MRWLVGLLALAACGRVGFDATGDAGPGVPDGGPMLAPNQVALGVGGNARFISAPGPTLSRFYTVFGANRILYSDDAGEHLGDCDAVGYFVIAIDSDAAGRVVVATSNGVWESTDACATFTPIGLAGSWVNTLRLDGATLFASTQVGLQRYAGTSTWTRVVSPTDGVYINDILGGGVKLMGSSVGVLRSIDGTTWTAANNGLPLSTVGLRLRREGANLWACTSDGLYVSTDGALSWTLRHDGFTDMVAVDPADPNFVLDWFYNGFALSSDGGMTWTEEVRTADVARSRVHDIAFDPSGSGASVLATGRGLFQMDSHAPAFRQIGNLDAWEIQGSTSVADGTRYIATHAGMLRLVPGQTPALLDPHGQAFSNVADVQVFNGGLYTSGRNIARSPDGGDSFTAQYVPDLVDSYLIDRIVSLGTTAYATTSARVLRSTDGTTWAGPTLPANRISAIAVVPNPTTTVIVGTERNGLYVSTNGGTSYMAIALPHAVFALQPLPDGSIVVGTSEGLYRATAPLGPYSSFALAGKGVRAVTLRGTTLFASVIDEIWKSTDGGATWTRIDGFPVRSPTTLEIDAPTGDLIIGTSSFGLYRVPAP